jgi:competence protein ComEC
MADPTPAPDPPWKEFARAPLVPVAVAATLGLVVDRAFGPPLGGALLVAAAGILGGLATRFRTPAFLWVAFAGLAAAYHHDHRHRFPADDIGTFAVEHPQLARVRGILLDEPTTKLAPRHDPLAGITAQDRDTTVLRVTAVASADGWVPATGKLYVRVDRETWDKTGPALAGLHAGDAVEVVGSLSKPRTPGNPGESDYASFLLDQRIRAELWVSDSSATVTRLDARADWWPATVAGIRGHAAGVLTERLSAKEAVVARALLLGDTAAMDRAEWDGYVRTGVVHVLAISGQHLVVLGGFAWVVLRVFGVHRGRGAWVVMLLLVGYAVVTGLKPSGVRAAVMVAAVCGGLILRRPVLPANTFAAGWLVVIALNPADAFSLGCRLSFVAVFVLVWLAGPWLVPRPLSPVEELVDESRSVPAKLVRSAGRAVLVAYAVTLLISAVVAPMVVADQNLLTPVGVLVGPPLVVLTSVALIAGFLLILCGPLGVLATPFAWATEASLAAAGAVVRWADELPGGSLYTVGPPAWWVVGFYVGLAVLVLLGSGHRARATAGLAGWVFVLAVVFPGPATSDETRVAFLSVGFGGCTVIETPDGRCLLYDAGTTTGPAAVRRVVAPYLWSRGFSRVDELFVSHADSDHFNGVAELLKRFRIGRVTLTPSFAEKPTAEVAAALLAFDKHAVPMRTAAAGDVFVAGGVRLDVLHPPPSGPGGSENERSLVLAVRAAGHTLLLTGDLEKAGTARVLGLPPVPASVLMGPHHGSRAALPEALVRWCAPRLVVVSRGPARGNSVRPADVGPGVLLWDTWDRGAVTLRCHATGIVAESFRDRERVVVGRPD